MHIVQDEHERLGRREPFQELPHGPIGAVPRMRNRGGTGCREPRQGRKDRGQLGDDILTQCVSAMRFEGGDVLVERIHENPERQVGFEFRGGARQHEVAKRVGPSGQFGEKAGLADSELAPDLQCGRPTLTELGKGLTDRE